MILLPNLVLKIAATSESVAECLRLRHAVFVDEQNVPVELEIDEHDHSDAIHFIGTIDDQCVATSRICLFGDKAKIQRVAIDKGHRGAGHGRAIMQHMINHIRANRLAPIMALDAQTYALSFYEALGFVAQGEEFDDAGIPHIHMVQPA